MFRMAIFREECKTSNFIFYEKMAQKAKTMRQHVHKVYKPCEHVNACSQGVISKWCLDPQLLLIISSLDMFPYIGRSTRSFLKVHCWSYRTQSGHGVLEDTLWAHLPVQCRYHGEVVLTSSIWSCGWAIALGSQDFSSWQWCGIISTRKHPCHLMTASRM